jgi:phosphotriesterase-related protein
VSPDRYAADAVFAAAKPRLERVRELGARAMFECTPRYLGRDVRLLRRLSEATGLHLVTNTGLYGARTNKFLPAYAHTESARQLADRWIAEARDGIDGTDIRPGFIKSGVDGTPALSPLHRKLVEAAALAHRATGLTIAVHTGGGPGLEQLDVLRAQGVSADAWIWVHAQGAPEEKLLAAAERGAWLAFDGIDTASLGRHAHLCTVLREHGHLGRVLVSHDGGWFDPDKPGGGDFSRSYELLFTRFLPALRQAGFSESDIDQLVRVNPARAFGIQVRARG